MMIDFILGTFPAKNDTEITFSGNCLHLKFDETRFELIEMHFTKMSSGLNEFSIVIHSAVNSRHERQAAMIVMGLTTLATEAWHYFQHRKDMVIRFQKGISIRTILWILVVLGTYQQNRKPSSHYTEKNGNRSWNSNKSKFGVDYSPWLTNVSICWQHRVRIHQRQNKFWRLCQSRKICTKYSRLSWW